MKLTPMRIVFLLGILGTILAFSPLALQTGEEIEFVLSIPKTLLMGFAFSGYFFVLILLACWFAPSSAEEDAND